MVYLDNAATTRVSDSAADLAMRLMREEFGNPSSLHKLGIEAESHMRRARGQVSAVLSCPPADLYFTSGGTEGNNIAVLGAAAAKCRQGKHIITSSIEHSSVLEPMRKLESSGYDVTFLNPDENGVVSADKVKSALREDTILVSIMSVNNEVGAVMPIREIADAVHSLGSRALIHTDAVQAYLKIPVKAAQLGVDLLTVSGHKIHAPKGVGALYIKKGVRITPLLFGGGQERGMRPGTESVPLIAAFGKASEDGLAEFPENTGRMRAMLDILCEKLNGIPGVHILRRGDAPHILSVAFERYPSEVSMRILESRGIYVSSGSACSRGRKSHVLKAIGIPDRLIDSAVRISVSRLTTEEDIQFLAKAVSEDLKK